MSQPADHPPPSDAIDDLQARFAQAWQDGSRPRIEDYLRRVDEPSRHSLLRALITTETWLRRRQGEQPSSDEYRRRFPEDRELVDGMFSRSMEESEADDDSTDSMRTAGTNDAIVSGRAPTIAGRYRIRRVLGQGAFAAVYEAYDMHLQRSVAVKVEQLSDSDAAGDSEGWLSEARTLAGLDHPGIVPVYDARRTPDGMCYLVEKYVEGRNLAEYAKEAGLTAKQAARIVARVAKALHHAHVRGLVHRDVKPANILIDQAGEPLVADFGLALRDAGQWQRRGEISGTPAYMSPEQVRGEAHRLDGRTDVWSLGVILYELLTGRRPFLGENRQQLFDEIERRAPKPMRMIDDGIPAELERITLRCLAKEVTSRYQTAHDLAEDLSRWESQAPDQAASKATGRSRRLRAVAVGMILLVLTGLVALGVEHLRAPAGTNGSSHAADASGRAGQTGEAAAADPVAEGRLVFATKVAADGRAIDPGTSFDAGIHELYAVFPTDAPPPGMQIDADSPVDGAYYAYLNVKPDSPVSSFGWRWYHEGQVVNEYETPVGPGNTVWLERFDYSPAGIFGSRLPAGRYRVVVLLGGNPAMSAELTIRPREAR